MTAMRFVAILMSCIMSAWPCFAWTGRLQTDSLEFYGAGQQYLDHRVVLTDSDGRRIDFIWTGDVGLWGRPGVSIERPRGLWLQQGGRCELYLRTPYAGRYALEFAGAVDSANWILEVEVEGQALRSLPAEGITGYNPDMQNHYKVQFSAPPGRSSTRLILRGPERGQYVRELRLYLVETDAFGYADSLRQQLDAEGNPVDRYLGEFQSHHKQALMDLLTPLKAKWERLHSSHVADLQAFIDSHHSNAAGEALLRKIERAQSIVTDEVKRGIVDLALRAAWRTAREARPRLGNGHYYSRRARWFYQGAEAYLNAARRARGNWYSLDGKRRMRTITYVAYGFHFAYEANRLAATAPPDRTALSSYVLAARNPQSAIRNPLPFPRYTVLLNGDWEFSFEGGPDSPPQEWHRLVVPHGAVEEIRYMGRGDLWKDEWHPLKEPSAIPRLYWYKCEFDVPFGWQGKHIAFQCNSSWNHTEVFLNGRFCGEHYGGIEPFEVNVTPSVVAGERNVLLLMVESTSLTDCNLLRPTGEPSPNWYVTNRFWGWGRGGIFQDCRLVATHPIRVTDLFACPQIKGNQFVCEVTVSNDTSRAQQVQIVSRVFDGPRPVLRLPEKRISIPTRAAEVIRLRQLWKNPVTWGIGGKYGEPKLYHLQAEVFLGNRLIDVYAVRFGVRDFRIDGIQFRLNGAVLPLQGDSLGGTEAFVSNRWFMWAYCHAARGANFNLVRHHYGVDSAEATFDAADEAGFLVEPECFIGTWCPPDLSGIANFEDPVWSANWRHQVAGMVREHRNHPSLALWSAENETLYHMELPFYEEQKNWFYDQFDIWIRRHAPHVVVDHHGSSLVKGEIDVDRRSQTVNIHYGDPSAATTWPQRFGHRPVIIGEMSGIVWTTPSNEQLMKTPPPERAARYEEQNAEWYRNETEKYHQQKTPEGRDCVAGLMPFTFMSSMLGTAARPEGMGPWSHRVSVREDNRSQWPVNIPPWGDLGWPAHSGPGLKVQKIVPWGEHECLINWSDPDRPRFVPNKVYEAVRNAFYQMPPCSPKGAPEVVVEVESRNREGVFVFAVRQGAGVSSAVGVRTDTQGRAWFVLQEEGRYDVRAFVDGKVWHKVIEAKCTLDDGQAGFAHIQRHVLEMSGL